jgi:Tfp pilus assembly protein PilW
MKIAASKNNYYASGRAQQGFSLVELFITLTITLIILGLAFTLLARSLNTETRQEKQATVLADVNTGMGRMTEDIVNAGFGLRKYGIVSANSTAVQIRVRANLNALMKQTTSNSVTDASEDVLFQLTPNPATNESCLIRMDIGTGTSSLLACSVDNTDLDNDGVGDGLIFSYLNAAGNVVDPSQSVRVLVTLRVKLPQVAVPGSPGFQPAVTQAVTQNIVLRNSNLSSY